MQLSFDEFQELGVAFQQAHGCRHTGKDRIPKAESVDFDDVIYQIVAAFIGVLKCTLILEIVLKDIET